MFTDWENGALIVLILWKNMLRSFNFKEVYCSLVFVVVAGITFVVVGITFRWQYFHLLKNKNDDKKWK